MKESTEASATDAEDTEADSTAPTDFASCWTAIPSPVIVLDDEGRIVHANERVESTFGYAEEDVIGTPVTEFCPMFEFAEIEARSSVDGGDSALTGRARRADGSQILVEVSIGTSSIGGKRRYVLVVNDVSEYYERNEDVTQFKRVVQTIDDGVYVLDDSFNIMMVNDAVESMTGYSRSELVGSNATMLTDEQTIQKAATISQLLTMSENDAMTITATIETADGETLPIETRFSVYWFPDGSYGQVGVIRDISERIWYQETLTALHDSTRELLHAETKSDVANRIVDTAIDVLDLTAAAVYLFDGETNALHPVATSDGPLDTLPEVGSDDGSLWDVFIDGTREIDRSGAPIRLTDDVTVPTENGTFIPLDDHGVFFVAMRDRDSVDTDTLELIDLLAASAETALERVDRETTLRSRDRELRERNHQLRRLKQTNEIIRRIDAAIVDADSRGEVEAAVCENLIESSLFAAAWIGQTDGDELVPRSWAGDTAGYVDAVDLSLNGTDSPPSVRAATTGELAIESEIATDLRSERWRTEAITREFQSAISTPLSCDGVTYGVLTVYSTEQSGFDEQLQTVFTELAETIANALRVVETKQWLSAERVVRLALEVDNPTDPLSRIASNTGHPLELEGVVAREERHSAFVRVPDATAKQVTRVADRITGIDSVRVLGDEDSQFYEVSVTAPTLAVDIAEYGGRIRSLVLTGESASVTVEVPYTTDVRSFVERIESAHDTTQLLARREESNPARRPEGFRATLRDRLTERQQQILRTAYLTGFFDWPRKTTGAEIAESFDVTQPTINRHLRIGQRKCLELLFDDA
ncbi:PAS domain S-box protein [Halovenus marina]|uniref:PAS domain S-box protein n=1 Tax=Halovenus marina TaxID=3396621 RepID=UPI003F575DEC